MSFKRETNDISYLNSLRQRRIKDLLAEDIPEDEASLLSNGRFACTVCAQKPVFDTVNMLAVHRNGKKHQASAFHHEKKKEELKELIRKRKHEEFLKTGSTDIKIAEAHLKSLANSVPYDSRTKKKLKPYDRRPKINLASAVEATSSTKLPGNRISEMIQMQNEGPVRHPSQLKKMFESPDCGFQVQPYQRKSGMSGYISSPDVADQKFCSQVSDPAAHCESARGGRGKDTVTPTRTQPAQSNRVKTGTCDKSCEGQMQSNSSEKKGLAQKYWQMAGSGWKKDWDGKWIRDEECEFDSDEEPPDLP